MMTGMGAPWERLWKVWENLGLSPDQCGNPKLTVRDAGFLWISIGRLQALSEILRMYMSNQNTLHSWCIDYCSLSTSKSYYGMQHLINILLCASLHWGEPKKTAGDSTMNVGETEPITWISDRMICIKHSLNVIQFISNLIRAENRRNTQFINGAKELEALLVFPNESGVVSGLNWIPMSFGSICDIWKVWNWC